MSPPAQAVQTHLHSKELAGMTSQSAPLSHQFLVNPQGSSAHCNASAQLKNPFVVTCQKNLASLSAGDSCSLDHASLLLSGYLKNTEGI